MESAEFACLAPEIVYDIIDQIDGRYRFTADHLTLSQLAGTWGDFFRGAGSVFYTTDEFSIQKRLLTGDGRSEESRVDDAEVEKLPENIYFYVDYTLFSFANRSFDLLCRTAHRFYGDFLELRFPLTPEDQKDEETMAGLQRCLAAIQPRFERIRITFSDEILNPYIDFLVRMLQSRFLRKLEFKGYVPSKWPIDLEKRLLPFCTSDRFQFFRSEHTRSYSLEFVSTAYEALRSKKCPFDLKPRGFNVKIEEETARRLAEKYEMRAIKNLDCYCDYGWDIRYWKQNANSITPGISVELLLTSYGDERAWWKAVVFAHKCNNNSLEEEYAMRNDDRHRHAEKWMDDNIHGVEMPAEVPFRQRSVNPAHVKTEGWFTANG